MSDEDYLRLAIRKAAEGIEKGQTPFGAAVVRGDALLSCEHNRVWLETDITAHAEILAIRAACRRLNSVSLEGCTIYSTCEPCPMCFSACHWSRIGRIVFGARIEDAARFGFRELSISSARMNTLGHDRLGLTHDLLREECLELFRLWSRRQDRRAY